MTIKELLRKSVKYLKEHGVENSILDAQLILCHVLNGDRLYLALHGTDTVSQEIIEEYNHLLQLRMEGMPVQYILGLQEFMSLPFKVTKDVLIPRADTETLVEYVIQQYAESAREYPLTAVDIGTGSGCIAVSLAYYIENIEVWAVDISSKALEVARHNAENNHVAHKVHFIQYNMLEGFPKMTERNMFDIIVSNPPYIPTKVIDDLQIEVKGYEPHRALNGGMDGLLFYPIIVKEAEHHLKPGGLLALEVGHDQSERVVDIIRSNGSFENLGTVKDLAGIHRVVTAKRITQ